jgi:2-oxoglutarate ferredoxin oxidoreductase subunit delta
VSTMKDLAESLAPEEVDGPQVDLDVDLCKVCGICVAVCPEHVFEWDRRVAPVVARPGDCTSCLICEVHCPDFALEVRRRSKKKRAESEAAVTPEALSTTGACDCHHEEV